jgi:hypothetical protein
LKLAQAQADAVDLDEPAAEEHLGLMGSEACLRFAPLRQNLGESLVELTTPNGGDPRSRIGGPLFDLRLDARRHALGKTDCDAGVDLEVSVLGGVPDERIEGVAKGIDRVRLPETDSLGLVRRCRTITRTTYATAESRSGTSPVCQRVNLPNGRATRGRR